MKYQLITFDLDGTLVDTASEIVEAANRTLEEYGVSRRADPDIVALIGKGTRELMMRLRELVLKDHPQLEAQLPLAKMFDSFDVHYAATTGTSAKLYPRCLEGLQRLQQAGVKMACVTNKEHRFAIRVLEVTGLTPYFPIVLGGDSLPEKKPHPSMIEHCLQALGVSAEKAAHLGDSHIDVDTAKNAKVQAWAVPYGYNGGKPIASANPDLVFNDIGELADFALASSSV